MSGRFTWHTLFTHDQASAQRFYEGLFGWTAEVLDFGPGGTYTMLQNSEDGFGGIAQTDPSYPIPPHWASYLQVPQSVNAATDAVSATGGSVMQPPFDIPGVGRMSVVADPQGASFILYNNENPDMALTAMGYGGVTGGVSWMELMSADPAAAATFYGSLANWTSQVMNMGTGDYTIMQDGETMVAGIMDLPKGMPQSAWAIYFEIIQDSVEAALAEVTRLGGSVAMGPMEVPGVGVIAAIVDPTGAMFNLMQSAT